MSKFDIWVEEPRRGVGAIKLAEGVEAETFAEAVCRWWESDARKPEGFTLLREKLALYDKDSGTAVPLHETEKDAAIANKQLILLSVSLFDGRLEVNTAKDALWDTDMMSLFSSGVSEAVTKVKDTGAAGSAILATAVGIIEKIAGRAFADKATKNFTEAISASEAYMSMLASTKEKTN